MGLFSYPYGALISASVVFTTAKRETTCRLPLRRPADAPHVKWLVPFTAVATAAPSDG